jgi:hypothetical protein
MLTLSIIHWNVATILVFLRSLPNKSQRVMDTIDQMMKIDIEKLK